MKDKIIAILLLIGIVIAGVIVALIPILLSFGLGYFIGWGVNLILPNPADWLPLCLGASFAILKYLFWKLDDYRE